MVVGKFCCEGVIYQSRIPTELCKDSICDSIIASCYVECKGLVPRDGDKQKLVFSLKCKLNVCWW